MLLCGVMASGGETVLNEYEWEKLPDMPTARCFTVGVHHLNNLYVLGQPPPSPLSLSGDG